ncbi:MAG: HAMP domain-containing protein [Propionibacteriales bacterium]|nr:HAMP domain-containing protein [Propionibacteriales bacterium]
MSAGVSRLSGLSLRVRLVAGFAATMLVVLTGAGSFVYWRVQFALDRELNSELADTSNRLASQVTPSGRLRDEAALLSGERYQVVDSDGRVMSGSPSGPAQPLLDPNEVRAAITEPVYRDIGEFLPGSSQALRAYATALDSAAPGQAAVLIVAAERKQRDEALRELLGQLLLAGLVTLLVTAVVGERLAKASLKPVERYRRQAAEITGGATGIRLDVPPGRDDEITRLGDTLNEMLQALDEALEHERRFVNDASHELRTPLTLIDTRVQLARRRERTVEQYKVVLDEIDTDISRLSRLADQLLDVGTLSQNSGTPEPADLAATVRAEVGRRRTLAPAGSPYSQTGSLQAITPDSTLVGVDSFRLEQLVGNLLDNAAVHGLPPVTVTVDEIGEIGRLVVSDAGAGMDELTLGSAPERFARSPEARRRPGSGLGLSLVYATVDAAGGELRLCFRGRHLSFVNPLPVDCHHSSDMTVTVLVAKPSTTRSPRLVVPPVAAG